MAPEFQPQPASSDEFAHLERQYEQRGYLVKEVDCSQLSTKAELLTALSVAFDFPSYFGHNWDAVVDCLSDMHWLPATGYILVLRKVTESQLPAEVLEQFYAVLGDVSERFRHNPNPDTDGNGDLASEIPFLVYRLFESVSHP